MNPTNRTIEEKLAIVQQLKSNSTGSPSSKTTSKSIDPEEKSPYLAFLIVRLSICLLLFGLIAFMGNKNPTVTQYVNAMITTEENGNLIDFMSPFTYTLQESVESAPGADVETQDSESTDLSVPSEE